MPQKLRRVLWRTVLREEIAFLNIPTRQVAAGPFERQYQQRNDGRDDKPTREYQHRETRSAIPTFATGMRRQRNSHGDADQLAKRQPLAVPGIGAVAELVRHTFAERGGERYGRHRIRGLRGQPEEHGPREKITCGKNRHADSRQYAAADDPWRTAPEPAVGMVGTDGDACVQQERHDGTCDDEHRQIRDAVDSRQTADGLRNEHRVERRHRSGQQH